jgi:ligand-binding sensor domain-containing protein
MLRRFGRISFFITGFLLASILSAQNIYFKRYTTADDLPSSVLYRVYNDSRGFLWISGNTGITRFDGRHFQTYGVAEGLADNEVFDIAEDKTGNIWFTTLRGICGYITTAGFVHSFTPSIFKDTVFVNCFKHDHQNQLWIGDRKNNIYVFKNDTLVQKYKLESDAKIDCFIEDLHGRMWFTTNNTSVIYYVESNKIKSMRIFPDDSPFFTAHKSILLRNGYIVIYGYNHFEVIDPNTKIVVYTKRLDEESTGKIICIYEGVDYRLWVGTTNGINVYSRNKEMGYDVTQKDYLKGEKITSITQDFEGHYWVSTINKGLIFIQGYPVQYFKFADNKQGNTLNLCASGNYMYAGTDDGRIYIINNDHLENIYSPENAFEITRIMASAAVDDGSVWFGTDLGITVVQGKNVTRSIPLGPVKKIVNGDNGDVWIGTSMYIFQLNTKNYQTISQIPAGRVSAMANGGNGNIYFSNEKGLNILRNGKVTNIFTIAQFGNARISDLDIDEKRQIIWVGTFGRGAFGIKNNNIEFHLDKSKGLSSNHIYAVECTQNGSLYLGLNKGINRLKAGKNGMVDIWFIDHQNGLIADEVNDVVHSKGYLYASTIDGICAIGENEEIRTLAPPKILLNGFYVNNQYKSNLKNMVLDYDENNIEIDLTGIAFQSGRGMKYKYKLEGLDTNYTTSTIGLVDYNALAPGKYTFVAHSVNYQNIESTQTVRISFVIYPAYWQTIWFQLFLGVVLFIIFLCGILVRIRLIKRREEEKTRLNKMLGELELTALKAQMNPHFIFNSLGSIQNLINRDKKTEANIYLSKFAKLLRLTLDNSDKKEIPLADEINMLELYLGLEALRFNNQFEYKIEMADSVDIYEVKIPTMILQPFCENAIKHGLLPKKADAHLLLQFEVTIDNALHCVVQDNGIGRVQRERLKESSVSGHVSKGIKITRNRLELVNQLRNKPAEIRITDLYDDSGKAAGTRVDILIPLED